MTTPKALATLTLIVSCALCLAGQGVTKIRHISERDGLSYRWVFDIIQDSHGFMWFATYDGLNRYDGENFITYKHTDGDTNSISTSKVFHVAEDSRGAIWTYGPDLVFNRIDPVSGHATKLPYYLKNGAPTQIEAQNMRYFASLSNGDFIIMFQRSDLSSCSLLKYDFAVNSLVHLMDIPTDQAAINFFSEHTDGRIWIWGMGIGYFLVDLQSGKSEYFPVETSGLRTAMKVSVPIDRNRDFWYPGDSNAPLDRFRFPDHLDLKRIGYLRFDNKGGIWINYGQDSLIHYDIQSHHLEVYGDPFFGNSMDHRAMQRFYVDEEGACWSGHFYGAARIVNQPRLFKTYLTQSELNNTPAIDPISAREILQYGDNQLLVRSNTYQLFIIDLTSNQAKELTREALNSWEANSIVGIQSCLIGNDGYLWSAQSTQLARTDLETGLYTSFQVPDYLAGDFPQIFEDRSGQLWWCSQSGLFIFDRKNFKFTAIETEHAVKDIQANFS